MTWESGARALFGKPPSHLTSSGVRSCREEIVIWLAMHDRENLARLLSWAVLTEVERHLAWRTEPCERCAGRGGHLCRVPR